VIDGKIKKGGVTLDEVARKYKTTETIEKRNNKIEWERITFQERKLM
jgi:hypothetical protein